MSLPRFRPTYRVSQFMALTGSDADRANFCLEAANGDFNSALAAFIVVGKLKFQDKPPEDHSVQKCDIDPSSALVLIGVAIILALIDVRIITFLMLGFFSLGIIVAFCEWVSDLWSQLTDQLGQRQ